MPSLTDNQLLDFLSSGYVIVQPQLMTPEDHAHLWKKANGLYESVRDLEPQTTHLERLGDNLRASIPEIDQMLEDPAVTDVIRSILGDNAFLHPHNYLHMSLPSDQPFHQDGNLPWNERGHYRSHRPDWLILFYYPQAVTLDNGPTEVLTGTQYWTTDIEMPDGSWRSGDKIDPELEMSSLARKSIKARDRALAASVDKLGIPDLERRFIEVPAGSVVIGNYDLIHRGSRTQPEQAPRYMFKFYFARTREPAGQDIRQPPALANVREELKPVIETIWHWSNGTRYRTELAPEDIELNGQHLTAGCEAEKVAAAYRLGADVTKDSLDVLLAGLHHQAESVRRASAYGLRQRCDEAADALIAATRDKRASVRRFAIFALGAVWSPGADALLERLELEADDLARSNAAYALGQISRGNDANASKILASLVARLQPGVEADNAEFLGLSRSTVRESVAYAILQLASNHELSTEERAAIAALLQQEPDRYVIGMLAEALAIGSADGDTIRALNARRWNVVSAPETA